MTSIILDLTAGTPAKERKIVSIDKALQIAWDHYGYRKQELWTPKRRQKHARFLRINHEHRKHHGELECKATA